MPSDWHGIQDYQKLGVIKMSINSDLARVRAALNGLKAALAADNYDLDVSRYKNHQLEIIITAERDACPTCLIPQRTMAALIRTQLPSDIVTDRISIKVSHALD